MLTNISVITLKGSEIEGRIPALSKLKAASGEISSKVQEELRKYAHENGAFFVLIQDGLTLIGYAMGRASSDIPGSFYMEENFLLSGYEGLGLFHHFFDEMEKHATGTYSSICFKENSGKDEGYNHAFWHKRGYIKKSASSLWIQKLGAPLEAELVEFN